MVCSALQLARRALVRILLALAAQFDLRLRITRDSTDKAILTAYRTVCKTVHPDKGGSKDEFQRLQQAKEAWDKERQPKARGVPCCAPPRETAKGAREKFQPTLPSCSSLQRFRVTWVLAWEGDRLGIVFSHTPVGKVLPGSGEGVGSVDPGFGAFGGDTRSGLGPSVGHSTPPPP